MCCPLKDFKNGKWICGMTELDCPEAKLYGFDYEDCSTYLEYLGELFWR